MGLRGSRDIQSSCTRRVDDRSRKHNDVAHGQGRLRTAPNGSAHRAEWTRLEDVRKSFASADQIGKVLVFDICHTDYRLINTVDYPTKRIFVKSLLSHKEYDRTEWMKWAKH